MTGKHWTAGHAWPAIAVVAPFVACAALQIGPGSIVLAVAALVVLALALRIAGTEGATSRFARRRGALSLLAGGLVRASGWLVVGVVLAAVVLAGYAIVGRGAPAVTAERADGIYEIDAAVAMEPLPACRPRVATSRVLLGRGANPRLTPEGDVVWFDAVTDDGRRQVHRLELARNEVTCWTCEEDGNNVRPSAGEGSRALIFETDRFVTTSEPRNHELQLATGTGVKPSASSIRLTIDPASDRAPILGPGAQLVVWSRDAGRSEIVGASIRAGHGGILLGTPSLLVSGGLQAVSPLAWSRDARSLVFLRGQGFGTGVSYRLDPATGRETRLGDGVIDAPAGTSRDGSFVAVATSEDAGALAGLPGWLGFVIDPVMELLRVDAPQVAGSGARVGETSDPGSTIDLGELAGWGAPSGISLAPDGRSFVLGQRRETPDGVEERLVEATLDCDRGTSAAAHGETVGDGDRAQPLSSRM